MLEMSGRSIWHFPGQVFEGSGPFWLPIDRGRGYALYPGRCVDCCAVKRLRRAQFGHISLKKDDSCMMRLNSSAPAAVLKSQSIVFDGPSLIYLHLSFQLFLVYGQKKKCTGVFVLPQEQLSR